MRRVILAVLFAAVLVVLFAGSVSLPARAASGDRVLILGGTVTGGASSIEATEATADGMAVDVVDASTWSSMTAAQFAGYRAIILGDPTCVGPGTTPDIDAATANASVWGPTINGNIVILGTDPVYHATNGSPGGAVLTQRGVDFAINQAGKTGAYISLSCYYHETGPDTAVPLLNAIGGGGFTVTGVGCYDDAHIVAESPALAGLTDADISNWSCSVHEAFQTWPSGLIPLAIAKDFDSSFTASDGTQGPPYILAGGDIKSFPLSLTPLSDSASAGGTHTVTAQLLNGITRNPVSGAKLGFKVTAGPNAGVKGTCNPSSCLSGSNGQVSWTYSSNGATGSDTIEAFYDQNSNGSADIGEPQTTAGMGWVKPPKIIVGMGDSYSSGEGNDPFDAGTAVFDKKNTRLDGCHRSPSSWERQIGVTQADHLACSGAVIHNLTFYGQERLAPDNTPQIVRLRSIEKNLETTGKHVDDIVLTIGGNDVGFASILGDCFVRQCLAHFDKNEQDVQNLRSPLASALALISVAVPSAKVILVGYPRLFPGQQSGNVACGWLTPTERERANTLAADLDVVEHKAANDAGVAFVSVADALDGHELCSADSWVFPLNPIVYGRDQRQAHPTYLGQMAIAGIVTAHL